MFKYLIPLLILISPPLSFAGEILSSGLGDSYITTASEKDPVGIESITNRYVNGNYVVRIKLSSEMWEYNKKYVLEDDPSLDFFDMYTSHKITGETIYLSSTIPQAVYPKGFIKPVLNYSISQEYGRTKYSKNHTGIDFYTSNSKVYAPFSGRVVYAGWDKFSNKCNNGGNMIKIMHNNGLYSVYMHLKKILVKQGKNVKEGEVIAISGNTGNQNCKSLGNHLHFEIRTSANQKDVFNPRYILDI